MNHNILFITFVHDKKELMNYKITHYPNKQRFEIEIGGMTAYANIIYTTVVWISSTRLYPRH